ncbi:preprotein translocase subunit YajC [bacterium]|nr:preprotein translocase subunit YajC [bacterium]
MAPAGGGGGQGGGGLTALLPMVLIFLVFYFLILRPQSKKQKAHQQMLNEMVKGDKVVTTGGIHGTIIKVNETDKTLLIKVNDDVKLTVDIGAIARKNVGAAKT